MAQATLVPTTGAFADFVTVLEDDKETNVVYLVGRNYLLERAEFRGLLDDIENPDGFLDASAMNPSNIKLWMGPRGTVTPLHHHRAVFCWARCEDANSLS